MFGQRTRRDFFSQTGALTAASLLAFSMPRHVNSATTKGPNDFIIVEGHRDIWEQSGRSRLKEEAQHWPLANFIVPRLIEGGLSVVIMPAAAIPWKSGMSRKSCSRAPCGCSISS